MLAFLLATALTAPGAPAARVGTRAVLWSDVERRVQQVRAAGRPADPATVLEELVDQAALALEGERLGLERTPPVAKRIEAARRRLAAERFLEEEVYASARPDEATLRAMYHDGADWVHLEKLVLATREQAEAAAARLRAGASLADEARHSLDPASSARRGDMGRVSRGEMGAALAEVAFRARLGEVVGPVELDPGWAVVRVRERTVGNEKEFAERREQLARFAEGAIRSSARGHLVEMLARRDKAAVDEEFLRSLGTRLDFTPPELEHVLARVAGRKLQLADVVPDLMSMSRGMSSGHYSGPSVKIEIARHRLEWMLLEEEAARRGYLKKVSADQIRPERDAALADAAAERLRSSPKPPTEAEVEQAYRARIGEFTQPGKRTCSHVLLGGEKEATEVRRQLAGDAAFEVVARHRSRDPATAERGGLLGDITDARLKELMVLEPAFAAAVQLTPPGEVSAPARSRVGWHLVRCQPPVPGRVSPLSEVREVLRQRLVAERGESALRARLAELRRELDVRIDKAGLARLTAAESAGSNSSAARPSP